MQFAKFDFGLGFSFAKTHGFWFSLLIITTHLLDCEITNLSYRANRRTGVMQKFSTTSVITIYHKLLLKNFCLQF